MTTSHPIRRGRMLAIGALAWLAIATGVSQPLQNDYDDLDVIVAGRYPTISWVGPANNSVYTAPISASNAIALEATGGSRKRTVAKLEFLYRKDCTSCVETVLSAASLQSGSNKMGTYRYLWTNAAPGTYLVRAKVTDSGGGTDFAGPFTLTVLGVAPTVSVTAPTGAISIGTGSAYTVTVTANDADNGVASIQIRDGASNLGTACTYTAVASTARTCSTTLPSTAALGIHTITAIATDAGGISATSAPVVITVKTVSSTALVVTPNPSIYGASATLTATVSPGSATGTVNFTEGSTTLCSNVALSGATTKTATCVLPATVSAGSHAYNAAYAGDSATLNSAGTTPLTINKQSATVTVVATPSTPTAGQAMTLTATVNPNSATGSVNFVEGATTLCANVSLAGTTTKTATCTVAATSVTAGAHTYGANYLGDSNTSAATATQTVTVAGRSGTMLTASPTPSTYGTSTTLTATVTPATATGTVNFTEGAITHCANVALVGTTTKTATCLVAATATVGTHTYTAAYTSSNGLAPSTGGYTHTVAKAASAVTAAVAPTPSSYGTAHTLTATVTPATATGTVSFVEGTTTLCANVALTGATTKTATCSVAATAAVGSHTYTVNYAGDSNYTSASAVLSHVVNKATSTTTAALAPALPVAGQALTLTATVNLVSATGNVNFMEGATTLCASVPLTGSASKTASCTIPAASVSAGRRTYTISYLGDTSTVGSSTSATVTVRASSSITISVTPSPSVFGTSAVITATVVPSTATGTVSFVGGAWDKACMDTPLIGTSNNTATCTTLEFAPVGLYDFAASYSGDEAFGGATTDTFTHVVTKASAGFSLGSNPSSPLAGESFALVARTKTSGATGTVDFKEGATTLCTAVVLTGTTSKSATCTVPAASATAGSHTYTANYLGDGSYASSSINSAVVVKAAPTLSLVATPAALTTGQSVVLTASVAPASATGTVSFTEGTSNLCLNVALTGTTSKTATCTVPATAVTAGAHTYTASYSGDAALATAIKTLTLLPASTTLVTVSPSPSTFGDSRTVTATVTPPTATGTVSFTEGATTLCANVVLVGTTSKTATCTLASATVGTHAYAATYSGDASLAASTGTAPVHTVSKASPTLSASANPAAPAAGQMVVLTATLSPGTVTGSVDFKEGTTTYCAGVALTGTTTKTATCTVPASAITAGSHTYALNYSGDGNYNAVSRSFTLVAATNPSPTVAIVAPAAATSVAYGAGYATITASANDSNNGVISLQLMDGATNVGAACNFTPVANTVRSCSSTFPSTASVGAHAITAVAKNAAGAVATSAPVVITVNAVAPTIAITAPAAAASVAFGLGYNIVASANDLDGGIVSIQIKDGTTNVGAACTFTAAPNASRTCSASLPSTAALGAHSITAVATDASGVSTTSAAVVVTVISRINSSVGLLASPSPSTYGSTVTLTATVTPPSATGTVTFSEGATSLCGNVALSISPPKTATCLVPASAVAGNHTYGATYSGDTATLSASASVSHTVNKQSSAVTVVSNPPSPTLGQAYTLTATVSPATATGGVSFAEGGTVLCANVALSSASPKTASCPVQAGTASAAAGQHVLTASYIGDGNTNASSVTASTTVLPNKMQCSLAISPAKSNYFLGDLITLTPSCSANGVAIPPSAVSAQDWEVNSQSSFSTYYVCDNSKCVQTLTADYLSTNAATGQIRYSATMRHNIGQYSNTPVSLTINAEGDRIVNGGFEDNYLFNSSYTQYGTPFGYFKQGLEATQSGPGWVFDSGAGVARDGSGLLAAPPYPSLYHDGYQFGFVQSYGKASAALNLPAGGYSLAYQMANRSNYGGQQAVAVKVDGVTVQITTPPIFNSSAFGYYSAAFSIASAGPHTISFEGLNGSGDNTALFDAVKLYRTSGGSVLSAPSGCSISGPSALGVSVAGSFAVNCTGGTAPFSFVWTRSSTPVGNGSAGVSDTPFANVTTASVNYVVTISNAAGTTSASKTVTNTAYTGTQAPSGCQLTATPNGVAANAVVQLVATCASGTGLAYSWKRNGVVIAGSNASLTDTPFTGATPVSAGYDVVVSNGAGSVTVSVTVTNLVAPSVDKIAITNAAIINGQVVVSLRGSATTSAGYTINGTLSNSATGASSALSFSNGQLNAVAPAVPGIYVVAANASNGVSNSTSLSTIAVQAAAAADDVGAGTSTNVKVGTIGGSFGVAESGAGTYTIPIQVPPGTNGIQPTLSLTYSSQGGYGTLGVGWNLSGLGAITRCPKNIAQDGYRESINYDDQWNNDEYCYGGQRLVRVGNRVGAGIGTSTLKVTDAVGAVTSYSSTESASRQTFSTEIDSYSRITGFYGDANVKDGISRFEVETKDGKVLHFSRRWKPLSNGYELCPDANTPTTCARTQTGKLVKAYLLDRVEDRAGNTMEIDYGGSNVVDWVTLQTTGGATANQPATTAAPSYPPTEFYPTQIRYTSNPSAGAGAFARVDFTYETMPASAQMRSFDAGGGESITTKQLTAIDTYESNVLRKRYRLEYQPGGSSSSGRSLLTKIRECFDAGDVAASCTNPTSFEWQDATFAGLAGPDSGAYATPFIGNHRDFAFTRQNMVADIRGNGRSQWVRVGFHINSDPAPRPDRLWVCEVAGGAATQNCQDQYVATDIDQNTGKSWFWADVNGDGRADLVVQNLSTSGPNGRVTVCLALPDGSGFSTNPSAPTPCVTSFLVFQGNQEVIQGDFNGDGRIDFGFVRSVDTTARTTTINFYFGQANGSFSTAVQQTIIGSVDSLLGSNNLSDPPLQRFVVGDFNGDGLADVAEKYLGDRWRICMSRMDGSGAWYLDCPQDGKEILAGAGVATPLPYLGKKMVCSAPASLLGPGGSITMSLTVTGSSETIQTYAPSELSTAVPNFGANCRVSLDPLAASSASAQNCQNGANGAMSLTMSGDFGPGKELTLGDSRSAWVYPVNYSMTLRNTSTSVPAPSDKVVTWETLLPPAAALGGTMYLETITATHFTAPAAVVCTREDVRTVVGVSGKLSSQVSTVDVNGDGLADLIAPVDEDNIENASHPNFGKWKVCLSTGDGAFARYKTTGQAQSTCSTHTLVKAKMDKVVFGDFNGDGRTDILAWNDVTARSIYPNETGWSLCFAKGADATNPLSESSVAFDTCKSFSWLRPETTPVKDHVKTGDFNGDGLTDVSFEAFANGYYIFVGSPGGSKAGAAVAMKPDLVTKFTTGLNATTAVSYAPLTDRAVYDKGNALSNLGPDELHIQSPMQVVRQVDADNGIAGSFTTKYEYRGLKGATNGRGMLGFSERIATDVTGGFFTSTTYNNSLAEWYHAHKVKVSSKYYQPPAVAPSTALPTPLLLNRTTATEYTPSVTQIGRPSIYRAYGSSSKVEVWDLVRNTTTNVLATVAMPTTTTTIQPIDYDDYGNVKKSVSTTVDGSVTYTKTTDTTYSNIVSAPAANSLGRGDWILGRVTSATATHEQTGATPVTRKSSFTYYGVDAGCTGAPKGYLCEETLEGALRDDVGQQDPARNDLPKYLLWQNTRYTYDPFGNRTSATISYKDADNALQTRSSGSSSFDAYGRFATSVSNALGHTETRVFDGAFGNVLTTKGPNGFLTESTYDKFGRKLRERSFTGSTNNTAVAADASWLNQSCTESDPDYGAAASCQGNEIYRARKRVSAGPTTIVFYDRLQREVRAKTQEFNGGWTESSVTFDAKGRKATATRPAGAGTLTTTYGYDELNRVVTETLTGSGGATTAHVTKTTYNGLTTIVTQQAGATPNAATDQSMTRVVNSQGQVVSSTDALSNLTSFSYDAVGNLTQVSTAGGITESMGYDARGRKVKLVSPSAGTFYYTPNGLGELVKQKDGRGWESVMYYDTLGRLVQRREFESVVSSTGPSASGSNPFVTTWNFDGSCGANGPNGTSATLGKLCTVATTKNGLPNTQQSTTYDALGRAVQTLTELDRSTTATADGKDGLRSFISTVQFDANSRVERMGYPGGVVLRNNYKAWGGGLQSVTDSAGTTTHWTATSRYLDGQLQIMTVGGLTTTKGYDEFGRIDTINTASGAVQNLNVDFDRFGNLINRVDTAAGNILQSESFAYDKLNRLTTRNGQTVVTYDAIGNIQSLTGSGYGGMSTGTSYYTYDTTEGCKRLISVTGAQPRSMSGCTVGYDENGNLRSDGLRTMQYTAWNLPKQIIKGSNTLAYDYDHSHARVKEVSTQHGTTYYVGGYELVIPVSSTATAAQKEERNFIATPEGSVGVITQKTTANATGPATVTTDTAYWHKDHLGSLVAITNAAGTVTQRFRFDPWGNRDCLTTGGGIIPCSSSNTGGASGVGSEERGFTGHEMLDEVGLIHMNGRLFDPAIGRFTQADPIIQEPLNSQNYNRYSYVLNNPLVYTDPSGYSFWTKVRKPLAAVAAMIIVPWAAGEIMQMVVGYEAAAAGSSALVGVSETGDMVLLPAGQATAAAAGGFAAGGVSGGNIESAVMGAVQAGLSFGIGEATATFSGSGGMHSAAFGTPAYAFNVMAHAALGCGMSVGAGGSCKSGGLAGAFSAAAGPVISGLTEGNFYGGLAGRMAAGCVGSYIGKGSCEAGAVTAAFDHIYNAHGKDDPDIPDFVGQAWRGSLMAVESVAKAAMGLYADVVNPASGAIHCVMEGCSGGGAVLAAVSILPPTRGVGKIVTMDAKVLERTHEIGGKTSVKTVDSIAASMRESGYLGAPIAAARVDGRWFILDGHHRSAAARMTGTPVQVELIPSSMYGRYGYQSSSQIVEAASNVGLDRLRRF